MPNTTLVRNVSTKINVMLKFHLLLRYTLAIVMLQCYGCKEEKRKTKVDKICTEIRMMPDSFFKTEAFIRGAAPKTSLWPHKASEPIFIKVAFLNGTDWQKQKVVLYSKAWTTASDKKIRFQFLPDNSPIPSHIRISFDEGGSQSTVGTECNQVSQKEATMNFGWITENSTEEEIRQVVLHEFGHVIGLIHEHQSPKASIPWDSAKVYKYYYETQAPPWDSAKVNWNIFRRYSASSTNYSAYDSLSIMHYAVPAFLTKNGFSVPWNSDLSAIDKTFIKELYVYRPCEVNVDCCFDRRGRRIPCP